MIPNNYPLRSSHDAAVVSGTRVLVRIDANIPWHANDKELDDGGLQGRIAQAVPEILALLKRGAVVTMVTHWGDPAGKMDERYSTKRLTPLLEKRLKKSIAHIPACIGHEVSDALERAQPKTLFLLENIRFYRAEERNDTAFAKALAAPFAVYVNNAFGVMHRAHASVQAVASFLPSYAGELVLREVEALQKPPAHPFVFLLGGGKIETKISLLEHIGPLADKILIGGGVALALQLAKGDDIPGVSSAYRRKDILTLARRVLHTLEAKFVLPIDVVASPKEEKVLDIGPQTIELFNRHLQSAKSVLWNGPLGIIEDARGQASTIALAKKLATAKARVIVGGGETVDMLHKLKLTNEFAHVSTGGGAMLAFLSGERLPGLEVLRA